MGVWARGSRAVAPLCIVECVVVVYMPVVGVIFEWRVISHDPRKQRTKKYM